MPNPVLAVPQGFFNLAPKRWWRYKDLSTGQLATVLCVPEADGRYLLKYTLGSTVTDHHLQVQQVDVNGSPGEEYTAIASRYPAGFFTWIGGLKMPAIWKVGDSVHAQSRETNSVTGNPMVMTLTLTRQDEIAPPVGTTYPPGQKLHCIEIEHDLKDSKGYGFAKGKKLLVFGAGMASADGIMCGVPTSLRYQSFGDGPMPPS
jgi:hypothetical protein